jgi:anti-sigma B factor antagonist
MITESSRLELRAREWGQGVQVLSVEGTLDIFTYTALRLHLDAAALHNKSIRVVVDLTKLRFVSSAGWSVLLSRRALLRKDGGNLVIFGMDENLARVYSLMKINRFLPSADHLEDALSLVQEA